MIKLTSEIIDKITSIVQHLVFLLGYKLSELAEKFNFIAQILARFWEGANECKSP